VNKIRQYFNYCDSASLISSIELSNWYEDSLKSQFILQNDTLTLNNIIGTDSVYVTAFDGYCESDVLLIELLEFQTTHLYTNICDGDSIFVEGNYQNSAGIYYDTLQTMNGCDSILITSVSQYVNYTTPLSPEICQGDSIFLQGDFQSSTGIYYDTIASIYGL